MLQFFSLRVFNKVTKKTQHSSVHFKVVRKIATKLNETELITMTDLIKRTLLLLGLSQDDTGVITEYLNISKRRVLTYTAEKELNEVLEDIVVQITVATYRQRGFEGLKTASEEGGNYQFTDIFQDFQPLLNDYLSRKKKNDSRRGFRFI